MTNQIEGMQKELLLLALEIQETEFKMEDLSKDYGKNESMLAFYDKIMDKKMKRFLDLKIKIERMESNV